MDSFTFCKISFEDAQVALGSAHPHELFISRVED